MSAPTLPRIPIDAIGARVYHKPKGKPYAHGSTREAADWAATKKYDGIDIDLRKDADGNFWWVHQANPTKRDAWFDPNGVINDSHAIDTMRSKDVARLSYKDQHGHVHRIMSLEDALRHCKRLGLIPFLEDKTFTGHAANVWRKVRELCDEVGVVAIVMSLPGTRSRPGTRKLQNAHDGGMLTCWLWRPGSKIPKEFVDLVKSHRGRRIYRVSKTKLGPAQVKPKPPTVRPKNSDRINLGLDSSGRPLVVERRTLDKLHEAERRLGFEFTIVQGSWRGEHGASKSADTHAKAGVIDLRSWNLPENISPQHAVKVLRQCGLITWFRTKAQGFDEHFHAIDRGNPRMHRSAKDQVKSWKRGRNGLRSQGPDDGARVKVPFFAPKQGQIKPPVVQIPTPKPKWKADRDGIDISHHQSAGINWLKARHSGVKFVWHKCTEGTTLVDRMYAKRREECRKAGIAFGAYVYCHPSSSSGQAHALNLIRHAQPEPGDLRMAIDLEEGQGLTPEQLTSWVEDFVRTVVAAGFKAPVLYTNQRILRNPGCFLWLARYNDAMKEPVNPAPGFTGWDIWQFTNGVFGKLSSTPGVGLVDANTLHPGVFVRALKDKGPERSA